MAPYRPSSPVGRCLTLSVVSGGLNFSEWAHQCVSTYCFRMTDASCEENGLQGPCEKGLSSRKSHAHAWPFPPSTVRPGTKSQVIYRLASRFPSPLRTFHRQVQGMTHKLDQSGCAYLTDCQGPLGIHGQLSQVDAKF